MIQNAFHVQEQKILVYHAKMESIFLLEILAKNAYLTVTAVLMILHAMSAGEVLRKMLMENVEDVLSFVQVAILPISQLVPLAQLVFNSSTLSVSPVLINVKSVTEIVANNVPLGIILIQPENVSSIASCLVLHVLIINHLSVLLALEAQFYLEENAILIKIATKQALARIAELDSISSYSKVNVIHALLLQISMVVFNAVKQINNFAVFVKEDITLQLKELVLNAQIAA